MTSSEWAAWVQAFGSIAAIVFAWWQGSRALRNERKKLADSRRAKQATFVQLTESAIQMLQRAREEIVADMAAYWHNAYRPSDFQARARAFEEMSINDFDNPLAYISVLEIQGAMSHAKDVVLAAPWPNTREWVEGGRPTGLAMVLGSSVEAMQNALDEMKNRNAA